MEAYLIPIFNTITQPPGNLAVHLALAVSIMITMQAVIVARRSNSPGLANRLLLGLSAILLGQVVLFAASGLAWQAIYDPHVLLPPLDRAVFAWSMVWIAWLWSVPNKANAADTLNGLLNLVVIILLLFTLTAWSQGNLQQPFNATFFDWGWGVFSVFIIFMGILFLLVQRPEAWGIGLGILLLNLAGSVAHILWGAADSDFAAAVRLAQIASYPLLPSLAHRLNQRAAEAVKPAAGEADAKRRYTADPRAVHAWLQVAAESEPEKTRQALVRAIAQTMLADLCFLVKKPNGSGSLVFEHGYDLVRDEAIGSKSFQQADIPNLAGAVIRSRPIRQGDTGQIGPDLKKIGEVLELERPGNLLSIPLSSGLGDWGSVVLLSPYSGRVWSAGDQNYLLLSMENIVQLLTRAPASPAAPVAVVAPAAPVPVVAPAREEPSAENRALREQIENLKALAGQLHDENRELNNRLSQTVKYEQSEEVKSLRLVQHESQDVIRQLSEENERLRAAVDGVGQSPQSSQLEKELRASLEEIARLQNGLAGANMKILALEMQNRSPEPGEEDLHEVMATTVHNLRQPITSVIGYTDLLLAESVGLLGTLQRKFLERVRASTERMLALLDDFARVTASRGVKLELASDLVDTSQVIDTALGAIRHQVREKGISLSLELPDELPQLQADQDAIEQILIHLLQNASAVTPPDGRIHFRVSVEESEEQPYLLMQITDSGGGIAPEDMPRIFFRHFRAESSLVQGVADKSIGLSLAKVLAEGHGGRIWVDSIPGETATFSVLIPVGRAQSHNQVTIHESIA